MSAHHRRARPKSCVPRCVFFVVFYPALSPYDRGACRVTHMVQEHFCPPMRRSVRGRSRCPQHAHTVNQLCTVPQDIVHPLSDQRQCHFVLGRLRLWPAVCHHNADECVQWVFDCKPAPAAFQSQRNGKYISVYLHAAVGGYGSDWHCRECAESIAGVEPLHFVW